MTNEDVIFFFRLLCVFIGVCEMGRRWQRKRKQERCRSSDEVERKETKNAGKLSPSLENLDAAFLSLVRMINERMCEE